MYTEKDLDVLNQQLKRRKTILLAVLVVLLAGIVYSLVIRLEWLTTVLTIAAGIIAIATYDLALQPIRCYRTHVENVLHGRTRQMDGTFRGLSEEISMVDGVLYRAMTLEVPDEKGKPSDRLFYFDTQKAFPDFADGDMIHVVYHDREIAALSRV